MLDCLFYYKLINPAEYFSSDVDNQKFWDKHSKFGYYITKSEPNYHKSNVYIGKDLIICSEELCCFELMDSPPDLFEEQSKLFGPDTKYIDFIRAEATRLGVM